MNKTDHLLSLLKKLILEEQRCLSSKEVADVIKQLDNLIVDDVKQITLQSKIS